MDTPVYPLVFVSALPVDSAPSSALYSLEALECARATHKNCTP
ncbi:uncharacterized protein CTRU02_204007 [Colletotrichum truncatum]|uniref:Uncharacterized protein n=1 Tax=Colletotrichum truncatum TaxID=5467 RepID=A0ACC3ZAX0_COLTU